LRTIVWMIIGGVIVGFMGLAGVAWGWQELKLRDKSTDQPVELDLAQQEAEPGKPLANYHVKVGRHNACYGAVVVSYQAKTFSLGKPKPTSKVNYAFYPIISPTNPESNRLEELGHKANDLEKARTGPPRNFVVLVKTTRFKTLGELPSDIIKPEDELRGMVINEISPLKDEEKKLIQQDIPKIDFNKVLILEEGRTPSSSVTAYGAMVCGGSCAGLAVLGVLGLIVMSVGNKTNVTGKGAEDTEKR
jgi:hypothetical protein